MCHIEGAHSGNEHYEWNDKFDKGSEYKSLARFFCCLGAQSSLDDVLREAPVAEVSYLHSA